jgi:hypothetical protein
MIALTIPRGGEVVECTDCHGGEAWGRSCETCNGGGYVVTENVVERTWNEIGEAALEISDVLMSMDTQLGIAADSLQVLIAKAADTPHDDEERKAQSIRIWRATLENIRAAQAALLGAK